MHEVRCIMLGCCVRVSAPDLCHAHVYPVPLTLVALPYKRWRGWLVNYLVMTSQFLSTSHPLFQCTIHKHPMQDMQVLPSKGLSVGQCCLEGTMVEGTMVEGTMVEGMMVEGMMVEGMMVEGMMVEGTMVEGMMVEGTMVEGMIVRWLLFRCMNLIFHIV